MMATDPRLTAGVAALKAEDRATGAAQLAALLYDDPTNGFAWLWYATVVSNDAEKRYCLQQTVRYGPASAKDPAKRGLAQLGSGPAVNPLVPMLTVADAMEAPPVAEDVNRPPPASKGSGCVAGTLIVLLVVLGCIGLLAVIGRPVKTVNSTGAPVDTATNVDAFYMCQTFLKRQLKAPSTATFDSLNASTTQVGSTDKPNSFQVDSFVTAQNSYGAPLRIAYVCRVHYTGNNQWQLEHMATSDDI
jgi:hypothetical protein